MSGCSGTTGTSPAAALGELIRVSSSFRLLAPVRLNVVCFTLGAAAPTTAHIVQVLQRLRDSGEAFLTPTQYAGEAGVRAAFSNWRTETADVARVWAALRQAAEAAD